MTDNIKVDSWWRWLIYHCSYCLCKCDQSGPDSDRYWSLKAATADITQNKVVTGVRFVKKDRIIHLEIQQAVAVAEGGVQDDTREWKEAESLDVETAKPNEDIMVMSYEQRAFDTDRLQVHHTYKKGQNEKFHNKSFKLRFQDAKKYFRTDYSSDKNNKANYSKSRTLFKQRILAQ